MTTQKFTIKNEYDKGYGYQLRYVLNEWSISRDSYNTWGITRNGCFMFAVGTLTIAKNYVEGVIKMEAK
tara:strand:+ start:633 stop:839 length:207 start_codon:yes stop_codon:yes gene_type:complete